MLLTHDPEAQRNGDEGGNLVMPKRNFQVLLLSEKVKSLELIRKIKTNSRQKG